MNQIKSELIDLYQLVKIRKNKDAVLFNSFNKEAEKNEQNKYSIT